MIQNNIILEKLRMQIPTTEYNQYVSKLYIDTQHSNENTIIFLAQNLFLANWAKRNYADKILQIIEHETGKKPKIQFTIIRESQKNVTQKKYILKSNQSFINPESRFDNFIIGECNRFAFETAKQVVKAQGQWNPLLIYGNTGLGKTHLLHAIANAIFQKNPNTNIISMNVETMFNEYRHRVSNKTMDQFRERFRKCDYLLIDDVQFLSNTDKFQEEFFNTFNDIVNTKGQIVMTSDKPPNLIDKLEKRLKSRFSGGMTAKIESPELNTKIDIIRQKCELNNIQLDEETINFLATQIHDNIREIEGIILNLHGHMSILNMPITPETVRYALKDRESEKRGITFDDIIKHIAIEYNIKPSEIRTKVRGKKHIAKARKIVAYIARNETTMTLPNIAAELNLKDHSAVSKQIKSITEEIKKDSQLNNQIQNTISKLKQNT